MPVEESRYRSGGRVLFLNFREACFRLMLCFVESGVSFFRRICAYIHACLHSWWKRSSDMKMVPYCFIADRLIGEVCLFHVCLIYLRYTVAPFNASNLFCWSSISQRSETWPVRTSPACFRDICGKETPGGCVSRSVCAQDIGVVIPAGVNSSYDLKLLGNPG